MPTISTVARSAPAVQLRLRTGLAHPGSSHYQFCVDSVQRKYRDRYGAVVDPRPDLFVTASDDVRRSPTFGRTLGVAGLTCAAGRRLLSENYLDVPVEHACADLTGGPPADRRRIAEMGPLVSHYPGTGLFLMRSLPRIARTLGYDFLLSTLTEELHGLARIAGWNFRTRTNARSADLTGTHVANWGTYYAAKPRTGILCCGRTGRQLGRSTTEGDR